MHTARVAQPRHSQGPGSAPPRRAGHIAEQRRHSRGGVGGDGAHIGGYKGRLPPAPVGGGTREPAHARDERIGHRRDIYDEATPVGTSCPTGVASWRLSRLPLSLIRIRQDVRVTYMIRSGRYECVSRHLKWMNGRTAIL